jgi:SAM-dependent methyltransferase
MSAGRRAGQRFDAQHRVTTEALVFLGDLDPDEAGASVEFATHYEPTPVADLERLLAASPLRPERATFVDVGSGMGRVVLLASRYPFRQIVGIEISAALHEIARMNLASFTDTARRCRDVRLVRGDAATFAYPRGNLVLYLYNPFRSEVLSTILARITTERAPGAELVILYHTPVERRAIEATGAFEVTDDLGFGLVYRLRVGAPRAL